MPTLPNQVCDQLPDEFWSSRVVVGVSGGSDSVGMLLALCELAGELALPGFQMTVAHFDHQWSLQSVDAASLVHELCDKLKVKCHTGNANDLIQQLGLVVEGQPPRMAKQGPEATARFLRYQFFKDCVEKYHSNFLLTGHTIEDQIETVLMRISRGTSISGLTGFSPRRKLTPECDLLRPLHLVHRQALVEYLETRSLGYYVDPSNRDNQLTRNRVRNVVLPWLKENLSSTIESSLLNLQQAAVDVEELKNFVCGQLRSALMKVDDQFLQVDLALLSEVPEPVVRQLLVAWWNQAKFPAMEMNRQHWLRLTSLAVRPKKIDLQSATLWPSQLHFPGPIVAKRSQKILTIERFK